VQPKKSQDSKAKTPIDAGTQTQTESDINPLNQSQKSSPSKPARVKPKYELKRDGLQHPGRFFTTWNIILFWIYAFLTTFVVNLRSLDSNWTQLFVNFHYLQLTLQLYIFVFYFAFLWRMVRQFLWMLPPLWKFQIDYIHIVPIYVLLVENCLYKHTLEAYAPVYPLVISLVYVVFNMW
jgi:hypothetical protein